MSEVTAKVHYKGEFSKLAKALNKFSEKAAAPAYAKAARNVVEATLRLLIRGSTGGRSALSGGVGTPQWSGDSVRNWRVSASGVTAAPPDRSQQEAVEALYKEMYENLWKAVNDGAYAEKFLWLVDADADYAGMSKITKASAGGSSKVNSARSLAYMLTLFYDKKHYFPEHIVREYCRKYKSSSQVFPKTSAAERNYQQNAAMHNNKLALEQISALATRDELIRGRYSNKFTISNPVSHPRRNYRESNRPSTSLETADRLAEAFATAELQKLDNQLAREAARAAKEAGFN